MAADDADSGLRLPGVAALAAKAGDLLGLRPDEVRKVRRAALVHDIGMHGVPATIWRSRVR